MYFAMEGRPAAEAGADAPTTAAVVRAVPVVLLADHGTRLNSGVNRVALFQHKLTTSLKTLDR